MSLMVNGKLRDDWLEQEQQDGAFVRLESRFRRWITPDGEADGFPAASGRYHLYVSLACPWAHRTLIFRRLKGLEAHVRVSVVHPHMGPEGWRFASYPGATQDGVHGAHYLHELYTRAQSDYSGIVTVPVLWDRQRDTIVNNESSEIIRMFNSAFDSITGDTQDFYPRELRGDIDAINAFIYENINDGVYRAGFASTQQAYEAAVRSLFGALDTLESRLAGQRYLAGDRITEADWRLLPTLLRFDAVYVGHFQCNLRRIEDYPNLSAYMRELYQYPGVADTFNLDHVKRHYYTSHPQLNPAGIIPMGPVLDLDRPHGREHLPGSAS